MTTPPPDRLSLELRLERLEIIARELDAGELELDEALRLFEEAVVHVRDAREQLQAAELRVEEVVGRADDPQLKPLDIENE